MFNTFSRAAAALTCAAGIVAGLPTAATAQESKSAPLARQLVQLLDGAKLESIAAADPTSGRFVAALYIPGTQLLVVSAKFPTPEIGTYRIEKKEYRELYMDLMGAALPGTRLVASDVSCDGFAMQPGRDAPADSWEQENKTQTFEGTRKSKLSDEVYAKAYAEADAEYARILGLLLAEAKPKGGGS